MALCTSVIPLNPQFLNVMINFFCQLDCIQKLYRNESGVSIRGFHTDLTEEIRQRCMQHHSWFGVHDWTSEASELPQDLSLCFLTFWHTHVCNVMNWLTPLLPYLLCQSQLYPQTLSLNKPCFPLSCLCLVSYHSSKKSNKHTCCKILQYKVQSPLMLAKLKFSFRHVQSSGTAKMMLSCTKFILEDCALNLSLPPQKKVTKILNSFVLDPVVFWMGMVAIGWYF